MGAGTKIFLAIVGLLVAVLVVYYGFLMSDEPAALVQQDTPTQVAEEPPTERPAAPSPRIDRTEPSQRLFEPRPEPAPEPTVPAAETTDTTADEESIDDEAVAEPDNDAVEPDADHGDAASPGDAPSATDDGELDDHEPVNVRRAPAEDGGKDAPELPAPSPAADEAAPSRADEEAREPSPRRPEPPEYSPYTVKAGDTMSSIAAWWFGDAGKWDLVAKANPYVDPNRLSVGQTLRLPPRDTQREEIRGRAGDRETTYIVGSGDNLTKIARAYYNDPGMWRIIYDANRQVIGDNPNRLRVGMRLSIPPAPRPADDDD